MPFTPANVTHPIKAYTFADTTPVNLATILGVYGGGAMLGAMFKHIAIQNRQAGTSVYIGESPTASAADSWEIPGSESYGLAMDQSGNGYDAHEYWIVPTAGGDVVIVMAKQ